MRSLAALVRQSPLASFFALAFAFTWALLPLAASSIAVSLVALCGPAVSAMVVSAVVGGAMRPQFRERLLQWRVAPGWYVLALLLPLPITALRSGVERLLGASGAVAFQPISWLGVVVFVLVAGEEIGWRGLALPLLRERLGRWTASVVLGAAWAAWHLPLFHMPGMPQYGSPFPAFVPYTIALSVILTVLSGGTRGSVPIATLFHGAVNTFGFVHHGVTPVMRGWSNALAYGAGAVLLAAIAARRPSASGSQADGEGAT